MGRKIRAVGLPALLESLEVIAIAYRRPFTARHGLILEPGAMGDGDMVLLSANHRKVEYASGDALCEQDTAGFLALWDSPSWKRPAWMTTLNPAQSTFIFKLAQTLSPWWGPRGSVGAWLNNFGTFYCNHRTDIDLAARHAGLMLDGLFGLRPLWTTLFQSLLFSMGEGGPEVFNRWVRASDVAPLLGILLGSQGEQEISVDGLPRAIAKLRDQPTPDFVSCMSFAPYPMLMRRAEEAALNLAPVIAKLRSDL